MAGNKGKDATAASTFDRELLKTGSKLYLKDGNGQDSGDWVLVLSRWSDPVRFTLDDSERKGHRLVAVGEMDHWKRGELIRDVWASMVADWGGPTFDGQEPTRENVRAWLEENPHHGEAIDTRSGTDRFFMKASDSSGTGSGTKSG